MGKSIVNQEYAKALSIASYRVSVQSPVLEILLKLFYSIIK